jgi:uncharacterized membrane protein
MQIHPLLSPAASPGTAPRLDGIDMLRGLVIVLMALDHTRDFFGSSSGGAPENVATTTTALFFTRWVTHFCAPTFVFLAGVGAFLSRRADQSKEQLAGWLCMRGVLLIFLELTVVHFSWSWNWPMTGFTMLQVIWAIGWSMVLLSFLIWLPPWLVGLLGVSIIFGHNLLDGFNGAKLVKLDWGWAKALGIKADWPDFFGERGWLWDLLFVAFRPFPQGRVSFFNIYPIIPWFGVLAAGYGLGPLFREEDKVRRQALFFMGIMVVVFFLVMRWGNSYGDPSRWKEQQESFRTFLSFLNCTKYPPSLLFLLMTLGPSLLLLALFDFLTEKLNQGTIKPRPLHWFMWLPTHFFLGFGRVPLFFYVIHLPVIHGAAKLTAKYLELKPSPFSMSPLTKGFDLPVVYAVWAGIVLGLFLPCLGYGWLKKRCGGILKLF